MIHQGNKCPCCGAEWQELSKREEQVYNLILSGASIQAISEQIFISPKTVATYVRRIRDKVGLTLEINGVRRKASGNASILMLRHHIENLQRRWIRGANREKLLARGRWGRGWLEGYQRACEMILTPELRHIRHKDKT